MRLERLANTVLQGCIDQQAHGHHHEQRHDALGLFEVQRGGQKLRVFQKAESALCMDLAFVAGQQLSWGQLGGVECIGGQDETTVLREPGLSRGEGRCEGALNLIDHPFERGGLAWPSPLGVAHDGLDRGLVELRSL